MRWGARIGKQTGRSRESVGYYFLIRLQTLSWFSIILNLFASLYAGSSSFIYPLNQWFSKCGPGVTASASPENLLKRQILELHPDLLNQKLWERGSESCVLPKPLGYSWCMLKFESPSKFGLSTDFQKFYSLSFQFSPFTFLEYLLLLPLQHNLQ